MSTSRIVHGAMILTAAGVVSGCQLFTGITCTDELRPGIRLQVLDSVSNAAAASGAMATARDGAFAETAGHLAPDEPFILLAWEREGTYTVTVEQAGYQTWSRSGVRVSADRCHVRTVSLTARLKR